MMVYQDRELLAFETLESQAAADSIAQRVNDPQPRLETDMKISWVGGISITTAVREIKARRNCMALNNIVW